MANKLIILGSKGMLGQMAKAYFTVNGFDVLCQDRRFEHESRKEYSGFLKSIRSGCLINCIGKIKQKTDDAADLLFTNSILPAELRNSLHEEVLLVHPSTDCVFNGKSGLPYGRDDAPDADDDYGWSKRLGDIVLQGRHNTLIPRVSIIGPDNNAGGKGLLSWVKSNAAGSTINGYTNHFWNGITTLEWCRQVHQFLNENQYFPFRIVQYGTKDYSTKYEMLQLFNSIFNLGLNVEPVETSEPVDRRLIPDILSKSLFEQLQDVILF